jgi:hypothetical protein
MGCALTDPVRTIQTRSSANEKRLNVNGKNI